MKKSLRIWGVCILLSACNLENADIGQKETFIKFFDFGEGYNIKETIDDPGFICIGTYENINGDITQAHLIKTDEVGNLQWLARFDDFAGRSVAELPGGGYIFVGDYINMDVGPDPIASMVVVLTNSSGDLQDTISIGDLVHDYHAQSFTFDTNGSLLVLGEFEDINGFDMLLLTKVNISGSTLTRDWTKVYGVDNSNNIAGSSVHLNTTGEIIWSGSVFTEDEQTLDSYMKIYAVQPSSEATNGSTQGENSTNNFFARDIQPIGNNFAIIGTRGVGATSSMYFIKVDHFGNIINASEKVFDDEVLELKQQSDGTILPSVYEGISLASTFDSGIILLGSRTSQLNDEYGEGERDFMLIKTDNSGNVNWWKIIGGTGDEYGGTVIETMDDGIAIFGTSEFQGTPRMVLIKTTKKGVIY
jgi:hypothetical protein